MMRAPPPTALAVLIDALDDLLHNALPVPLTDQVRVDPGRVAAMLDDMHAALADEQGEAEQRYVLDRLDALVREAKPIPLLGRVRVDREAAYDLLDQLRSATAAGPRPARAAPADRRRRQDLLVLVDRLDELVHDAPRVPMTSQIRVDAGKVTKLLEETRAAIGSEIGETPHAGLLDELETIVRQGRPVPLTMTVRIEESPVQAILDRIRTDVIAEVMRVHEERRDAG